MIDKSILENLSIHNDNLSFYYLGSVFISVLSVMIAWWYHRHSSTKIEAYDSENEEILEEESLDLKASASKDVSKDELMSQMNRRHPFVEEIAANLTQEQLEEEKEVEKQQLEAIYQLLQNQQDKYQVSSMEELEDQLRLYR